MTEDQSPITPDLDAAMLRHRVQLVAHDVRSLLGPIIGFAELIAGAGDIEQCRAHAVRITQASVRLETLADGLVERILDGDGPDDSGGSF